MTPPGDRQAERECLGMFVSFGHAGLRSPEQERWSVRSDFHATENGGTYRGISVDAGMCNGWIAISFSSKQDEQRFFEAMRVAAQEMDLLDGTATATPPAPAPKAKRTPAKRIPVVMGGGVQS